MPALYDNNGNNVSNDSNDDDDDDDDSRLLSTNSRFSRKDYWERRYAADKGKGVVEFEWIKGWSFYKEALMPILLEADASNFDATAYQTTPSDVSILHLGCGNSALSAEMFADGFTKQTNVDYSETVVERMRFIHEDKPAIKWIVADIFQLKKQLELTSNSGVSGDGSLDIGASLLQDDSNGPVYDIILDKGTFDAFLTAFPDDDPWAPSPECLDMCAKYMENVMAVLKPKGKFIQITWSQPHFRKRLLQVSGTIDVQTVKVGKDWEFFIYVCNMT